MCISIDRELQNYSEVVSFFLNVPTPCLLLQKGLRLLHLMPQSKRQLEILKDVSGRLEPGRFTLLLG